MSVAARARRPRAPPFIDPPGYARHRPETTLLYRLVAQHFPAFRELRAMEGRALPGYAEQEFDAYLKCGRLEEGFLRVRCEHCRAGKLVAFSCKKRGFCLRQLFIGAEGTLGIITAVVLRLFPKPRSACTGICAVDDYAGVLELLKRVRTGFGAQLSAYEVMWPDFYQLGTVELKRKPPLPLGHGVYVLVETLGTDPLADQERYETVIGEAIEAGIVKDAVVAQSQREATELWAVRDSPGEWSGGVHWPQLIAVFFGHVADGNLHVSVRMSGHDVPELDIENAVYGIVAKRRGSISAEHGIGSLKVPFLHFSRSPEEIALMRAIKKAMDPKGILNPGKLFADGAGGDPLMG